jgi:hypothetical protein
VVNRLSRIESGRTYRGKSAAYYGEVTESERFTLTVRQKSAAVYSAEQRRDSPPYMPIDEQTFLSTNHFPKITVLEKWELAAM